MGMRIEMGMRRKGEGERKVGGMRICPSSPTVQAELPGLPPSRSLAQIGGMVVKKCWGTCCREGECMRS